MRRRIRVLLLLATLLVAGCIHPEAAEDTATQPDTAELPPSRDARPAGPAWVHATPSAAADPYPACVHPYPCGDGSEWPADLEGPFEVAGVEEVWVESHDGTRLNGWVWRPRLPEGVKAPVVVWSSPYFGQTIRSGDHPATLNDPMVPVGRLVSEGYAVAAFSVRGTGNSGGCFTNFGPTEQADQPILVEWAAAQPWSNGRVAMMGLSYHATTAWEAAVRSPPALKTIVVAGTVSHLYTLWHTPQGSLHTWAPPYGTAYVTLVGLAPPSGSARGGPSGAQDATVGWLDVATERPCPEVLEALTSTAEAATLEDRGAAFWEPRRFLDDVPNVTAAVLLTHGLHDPQEWEASPLWGLLGDAPRHALLGQWMHSFPDYNHWNPDWAMEDWNDRVVLWLDFWLKGLGPLPASVGVAAYQDGAGAWHESTAWPPAEAREEALHLTAAGLAEAPAGGPGEFRGLQSPLDTHRTPEYYTRFLMGVGTPYRTSFALCDGRDAGTSLVLEGAPLEADALVAGNPFALLEVESDTPDGTLALHLVGLAPEFRCEAGEPKGARMLTTGAADLRFHTGGYVAEPFPVGQPVSVRIDLANLAEPIPAGHRLALVVTAGEPADTLARPAAPTLTLHPGSHLVLPVVEGTLGGGAPLGSYPPRPFLPTG